MHHGDNTTGDGAGDDETISIDFSQIDARVDRIWTVITIYTYGDEFDDVRGAYSRIYDPKTNQEFVRTNLSQNKDNISNGNIVANFHRNGAGWTFKAMGYYTKGTRDAFAIEKHCSEVMHNNFDNIKILKFD